ncbi:MAG: hypothetical protein ACI4TI_02815 [Christensenellales bacterium]
MENSDLKFLKKNYGENFAHLCRSLFPTLLEKKGLLSKVISSKFAPTHRLYDQLIFDNKVKEFKNLIFSICYNSNLIKNPSSHESTKTAKELLDEAGYVLYPECLTNEQLNSFKKYYTKDEMLCSFKDQRLDTCRVWFAVKKNVDEIKRENFKNPQRQDEYGTSVISIQFTKEEFSSLSIKNRYNHSVYNPDATFSNNLDNIISGLTMAFVRDYKIQLETPESQFYLQNFVKSQAQVFHHYNVKCRNIYCCENNILIDDFGERYFDKSMFVLVDEFVVNLKAKTVSTFDHDKYNPFIKSLGEIEDIKLSLDKDKNKIISIFPKKGEKITIVANKTNAMIKLINPNIKFAMAGFLENNVALQEIELTNLKVAGNNFLGKNDSLKKVCLPKLQKVGANFIAENTTLEELNLPSLEIALSFFFSWDVSLSKLNLPKLKFLGDECLYANRNLTSLNLPNLKFVGEEFLHCNQKLKSFYAEKLKIVGKSFLCSNKTLVDYNFSKLKYYGQNFLPKNQLRNSIMKKAKEKDINRLYYMQ